jgi:hypothetical protein
MMLDLVLLTVAATVLLTLAGSGASRGKPTHVHDERRPWR